MNLHEQLIDFANRHPEIERLEVFGSARGRDLALANDVDILVTFSPEARINLPFFCALKEELESEFGKPVDLMTRKSVERGTNPYRRQRILNEAITVYGR